MFFFGVASVASDVGLVSVDVTPLFAPSSLLPVSDDVLSDIIAVVLSVRDPTLLESLDSDIILH